jgi:hypothetical protein
MIAEVFSTIHVQIFYLKIVVVYIAVQYSKRKAEKGKTFGRNGGKIHKIKD